MIKVSTIPDWYSFVEKNLCKDKDRLKFRDRVVVSCSVCDVTEVTTVIALINQVRRIGTRRCKSCSGKISHRTRKQVS